MKVSNEDFVVAYVTSTSIEDIIQATGLKRGTINSRASYLRKHGVKLPKFYRRTMLDDFAVAQLNSLVKKYAKKG